MNQLNETQSPVVFTRKWLLLTILCLVPLFLLFAFLGDPGRGRAAGICAGVIATAVRANWNLRKHPWFWVTVTILTVLHAALVLFVAWSSSTAYTGLALLPVAALDYAIVYGSIKLAEKMMVRA
jgi:hypothetical protein